MSIFQGLDRILSDTIDNMTNVCQDSISRLNSLQERMDVMEKLLENLQVSSRVANIFDAKPLKLSLSYPSNSYINLLC